MKELMLKLKGELEAPLDFSNLTANGSIGEGIIKGIELQYGNRRVAVEDLFEIEEKDVEGTGDNSIVFKGNLAKARRIGYKLSGGSITIHGDAGMYIGEEMSQGHIRVEGEAGSWLGSKMSGGTIDVMKNAGDFIGSSYRGSREGMKGGLILVNGSAGDETGCWMQGGVIKIKGDTGLFPGVHMGGGSILVDGDCSGRAGAQMTAGTIIIKGRLEEILPSFIFQDFKKKAKISDEKIEGPFYLFSGDANEGGSGKLYVFKDNNPQLKWYERYMEVLE